MQSQLVITANTRARWATQAHTTAQPQDDERRIMVTAGKADLES